MGMKSELNSALVIASSAYQKNIYAAMRACDVVYSVPPDMTSMVGENYLLPFVKTHINEFGTYDAAVIDLGALRDTDEEIMEAIESIRYFDDSLRVIILSGQRKNSYGLLNRCFLNGIYNLIYADKYTEVQILLEKALKEGISYKEAVVFKSGQMKEEKDGGAVLSEVQQSILVAGAQSRVGVTHCVLHTAGVLKKQGYLVAILDCTGTTDYLNVSKSYNEDVADDGHFTIAGIDIYINLPSENFLRKNAPYNYVLYDVGGYDRVELAQINPYYEDATEKWLITGHKPWELHCLENSIRRFGSTVKYLFNMVSPDAKKDIVKMMTAAGIAEKNVFFLDYTPDYFEESEDIRRIMEIPDKQKEKKGLFKRRDRKK